MDGGTEHNPDALPRRRGAVQDGVLDSIRRGLMAGAFIPGEVLSLRKLAATLGTSPMPVRDSLTQLIASQILEEMPNRSVRVPRLTPSLLTEIFELRQMIEGMAMRTACTRITPGLIARLEKVNTALLAAIAKRDTHACLAANQHFHFALYEAAESQVLMPLIESLWLRCGPTMYFSLVAPDMGWDASAHCDIIAALHAGDSRAAERALARDIRTTGAHLLRRAKMHEEGARLARSA